MDQSVYALRVARALKEAERRNDESIAAMASLIQEMAINRSNAGLAVHAGHKALVNCVSALGQLSDARSRMLVAHDRLAADAGALGIPIQAMGPLESKPDPVKNEQAETAVA